MTYSKPEVRSASAIEAVRRQTLATKGGIQYFDQFENPQTKDQSVQPPAYEADE